MVLEALDRRAVNIKNLVLEEPIIENGVPFDPERDITEDDWQKMGRSLDIFRMSSIPTHPTSIFFDFLELGRCMNLLSPDRNIGMDANTWISFRDRLENLAGENDELRTDEVSLGNLIHFLASARIIFPLKPEIRRMSEVYKEKALDLLHVVHSDRDLSVYLSLAYDMAILFPEQDFRERLELDENTLDQINSISLFVEREHVIDWFSYAFHLGSFRLLHPQYKPPVGKKTWEKMKETLNIFRNRGVLGTSWLSFAKTSLNMKLIASEEVHITEDGVDIIMPGVKTSFVQPIPELPTLRRF